MTFDFSHARQGRFLLLLIISFISSADSIKLTRYSQTARKAKVARQPLLTSRIHPHSASSFVQLQKNEWEKGTPLTFGKSTSSEYVTLTKETFPLFMAKLMERTVPTGEEVCATPRGASSFFLDAQTCDTNKNRNVANRDHLDKLYPNSPYFTIATHAGYRRSDLSRTFEDVLSAVLALVLNPAMGYAQDLRKKVTHFNAKIDKLQNSKTPPEGVIPEAQKIENDDSAKLQSLSDGVPPETNIKSTNFGKFITTDSQFKNHQNFLSWDALVELVKLKYLSKIATYTSETAIPNLVKTLVLSLTNLRKEFSDDVAVPNFLNWPHGSSQVAEEMNLPDKFSSDLKAEYAGATPPGMTGFRGKIDNGDAMASFIARLTVSDEGPIPDIPVDSPPGASPTTAKETPEEIAMKAALARLANPSAAPRASYPATPPSSGENANANAAYSIAEATANLVKADVDLRGNMDAVNKYNYLIKELQAMQKKVQDEIKEYFGSPFDSLTQDGKPGFDSFKTKSDEIQVSISKVKTGAEPYLTDKLNKVKSYKEFIEKVHNSLYTKGNQQTDTTNYDDEENWSLSKCVLDFEYDGFQGNLKVEGDSETECSKFSRPAAIKA